MIRACASVVPYCADHHGVATERDRIAEIIITCAVVGDEFLLLCPHPAAAREDVGRTLTVVCTDVVRPRADHHGVAADRDRVAEVSIGNAVVGHEFLLERPDAAAAREDVSRTLIGDRVNVVVHRAHHQCVVFNRDRPAKGIQGCSIRRRQLLLKAEERVSRLLICGLAVFHFDVWARLVHHGLQ